jgi:heptosyltransferase-1
MVSWRGMGLPTLEGLPAEARILCLRLSALGDVVFALPALEALREALPGAEIAWLTEDRHLSLLEHHPSIDRLYGFPRKAWRGGRGLKPMTRHLRGLRGAGRWDLVLDFQGNLKSALQLMFLRSSAKVGFAPPVAREGAHRFLHHAVEVPVRQARWRRDAALLEACGWRGKARLRHRWALPEAVDREVAAALPDEALLLHTGVTAYGRDKAWPRERWIELAARLGEGARPLRLLWTPAEEAEVEAIRDEALMQAPRLDLELAPATPSLGHLMALLDHAAALVGTDSGPLHLGAYRGTPVVGLYGATDPEVYAPPGERVAIVDGGEGTPPPARDRSRRSPRMDAVAVDAVLEALAGLDTQRNRQA